MTTADFQHLILTRFNCKFGPDRRNFPGFESNSPAWLDERFALFERYCLPTVLAQTTQAFQWWVYFDVETPKHYLERAEALLGQRSHASVRLCDPFSIEMLKDDIRRDIPASCPWLLTTRLDNDDGLRADFVQRLHAAVRQNKREALDFPVGLVLGPDRLYRSRQPSNAFISVSEPYDADIITVHTGSHNLMATRMPVRDIGQDEPGWLQVIHGANVSNKLCGYRIGFNTVAGFPPLDLATRPRESAFRIALENTFVTTAWTLRDIAAKAYRKVRRPAY